MEQQIDKFVEVQLILYFEKLVRFVKTIEKEIEQVGESNIKWNNGL